jgi:antitoxin MazE
MKHRHGATWGNSLAVRLPKDLVTELGLRLGDQSTIVAASAARLEITKDTRRDDALARIRSRRWAPGGLPVNRDEAHER